MKGMDRCMIVLAWLAAGSTGGPLGFYAAGQTTTSAPAGPVVDFRYAPAWWQTCIGLPDDWQKTLVGADGELLYDYPGKFRGCRTRVSLGIVRETQWVSQGLLSPRVPIVRTVRRVGDIELIQDAFAVPPDAAPIAPVAPDALVVERLDVEEGLLDWARPQSFAEPAFTSVATHTWGPIHYCFRADGVTRYAIALGLCEGAELQRGQRILDLRIEGRTRRVVDLTAEFGRNVATAFVFETADEDSDGWIDIAAGVTKESRDATAILNALWIFRAGEAPPVPELITGRWNVRPLAFVDCGGEFPMRPVPRSDVIMMRMCNKGTEPTGAMPVLSVDSQFPVVANDSIGRIRVGRRTTILCSEPFRIVESDGNMLEARWVPAPIPPGGVQVAAFRVVRGEAADLGVFTVDAAESLRIAAEAYWQSVPLPYDRIQVPDPGVQALVKSSIRNIFQAREIKHGLPVFQVGPTCYRGLWVVDGSFLMEAAEYLGQTHAARAGIRYLLSFQREDGAVMLIDGHHKETGIAIWAVVRHARLTGDRAWLREVWPKVEKAVRCIRAMRRVTLADPKAPNAGLVPDGFSDGGLAGPAPEYTNVYWTLVGLKAAIEAARWLGETDEAGDWQREYDDFYATFRKAAERDMRTAAHGNRYLPIPMTGADKVAPQRAQWAFLHGVFPGRLFDNNDPLVKGNMAMLRAVEREGLVFGTGWMADGLWNYFGSFYGHAWLWTGDGRKAAEALYAFSNHASPLLCWREEQLPAGISKRDSPIVGDMPHNWASAEFVRLVRHLLVLERGDDLHLCEGMPAAWAGPGMVTRLRKVATEFGPISMEIRVAGDGSVARVAVTPPLRTPPARIVLHLADWSSGDGTLNVPTAGQSVTDVVLRPR